MTTSVIHLMQGILMPPRAPLFVEMIFNGDESPDTVFFSGDEKNTDDTIKLSGDMGNG